MKLGVLSTSPQSYSTQRFKQAALGRGHTVRVLDTLRFAISRSHGDPDLHYRSKPLSSYDAVLPRIVVLNLHRGSTVISNPKGSRVLEAGDKLLCYGKLESMRSMIPERRTSQRKPIRKLPPSS